jgi:uncharacterized protein with ATP-grasp and redox domains
VKVHLECIPCFIRQALEAVNMSTDNEIMREKVLREVLSYLSNEEWNKTTPEIGTNVHRIVKRITGKIDPYEKLKAKYNQIASDLYSGLKNIVRNSDDSLLTATKIAISGNAIDFGPKIKINIEKDIQNLLDRRLSINDINHLKESALKFKNILYLADNAGETFFDRILIEELLEKGIRVTYVVKAAPILNDATFKDSKESGIDHIAKVISTGTDCLGILFNECSKEFHNEFEKNKLIISKGQGNYESLNDIKTREIYFLLKIKCPIIARNIGAEVGSLVLKNSIKESTS